MHICWNFEVGAASPLFVLFSNICVLKQTSTVGSTRQNAFRTTCLNPFEARSKSVERRSKALSFPHEAESVFPFTKPHVLTPCRTLGAHRTTRTGLLLTPGAQSDQRLLVVLRALPKASRAEEGKKMSSRSRFFLQCKGAISKGRTG